MARIQITHAEQIEAMFDATPRQANIVLSRAINRAAIAGQTRASVNIRKEYYIKAGDIKKHVKIRKATANALSSQLRASGPVMPLMKFDVTPSSPNATQVRARVKNGSRKPIESGFIARTGNGHTNVFTRVGRERLPIKGRFGPSVAQMLGKGEVVDDIQTRIQDVLDTRLDHELDRLLRGEF
ncbi:MAG: phage tail protein [Solibacillus sp.]